MIKARLPVATEHQEQCAFVQWFRLQYPQVRILAVPNGGKRSITTAMLLKAEGVCAGVPDLFVPAWSLFIEMKRSKRGLISPEQKDWIEYLREVGYRVIVAKGCDSAIRQIEELLTSSPS